MTCPAYQAAMKVLGDGAVRDVRIVEGHGVVLCPPLRGAAPSRRLENGVATCFETPAFVSAPQHEADNYCPPIRCAISTMVLR